MVLIARQGEVVYYSRKHESIPYELKKSAQTNFTCLCCNEQLSFVNPFTRSASHVIAHFRHKGDHVCHYERDIDRYLSSTMNDFHKSWTTDIIKADHLYRYWHNRELCDVVNTSGDIIFARHSILKKQEVESKEKHATNGKKLVWILNSATRSYSLSTCNEQLYVDFKNKTDIPFFTDKSTVFLDNGSKELIQIDTQAKPHERFGFKAKLVSIGEITTRFLKDILNKPLPEREGFNEKIKTLNNIALKPTTVNDYSTGTQREKPYIVDYLFNGLVWKIEQAGKMFSVPHKFIPDTTLLLNGMILYVYNDAHVSLDLPSSYDALNDFFVDFERIYSKQLKPIQEYYYRYVEAVKSKLEKGTTFLEAYKKSMPKATQEDQEENLHLARDTITNLLEKVVKNITQVNKYNKIISALLRKNYEFRHEDADTRTLFNLTKYIIDVEAFITNPYSIQYKRWYVRDNYFLLEHIALKMGVLQEKRSVALLQKCLYDHMDYGHSCMYIIDLCERASITTQCSDLKKQDFLKQIIKSNDCIVFVIYKQNKLRKVYLKDVFDKECQIAEMIRGLHSQNSLYDRNDIEYDMPSSELLEQNVAEYEAYLRHTNPKFEFHENQLKAIHAMFTRNFTLITGPPGSGKSDVVKAACYAMIEYCNIPASEILLCAPTGKAASKLEYRHYTVLKKMGKLPGVDLDTEDRDTFREQNTVYAKTIHKALFETLKPNDFCNDRDSDDDEEYHPHTFNTLPYKVIIADEVSMLDTDFGCAFLNSIDTSNTKVVFIGDPHQLPSVRYGDFLRCLVKSAVLKNYVQLTKVFRYGNEMQELAESVRTGKQIHKRQTENIKWYKMNSEADYLAKIDKICSTVKEDWQIIIPTKTKDIGTKVVNDFIHHKKKPSNLASKIKYFQGERIICTKNTKDISNGEYAYVLYKDFTATDAKHKSNTDVKYVVTKEKDEVGKYILDASDDILRIAIEEKYTDYAYAITIHKSQGSEYDVVIIVLNGDCHANMLNKNLLYTAITRTKKTLHILYDSSKTLYNCIQKEYDRDTCFDDILQSVFAMY